MFDKNIYIARRSSLKERMGSGILLFLGNEHSPVNYRDLVYPFRQDSSFLYYFGLDEPGLAAIIDVDNDRETIFGADQTLEEVIWSGPQPALAEKCLEVGLAQAAPLERLEVFLAQARREKRIVHTLPPYRAENALRLHSLLGISLEEAWHSASTDLIKAIVAQRSIKADEELVEIETALAITRKMHHRAMQMARPGLVEREIVASMTEICLAAGGRPAFPMILTVKGHVLHNPGHDGLLKDGDLVINDSGAESPGHYAGDISRTIPVSGRFNTRQLEIYQITVNAQARAMAAIRPGVPFLDIHLLACETLAEGLKEIGLMKGDPAEAVAAGAHALFFQCGLGHMMGLDTHDMESLGEEFVGYGQGRIRSDQFGLKSLRMARPVEAGFVLTVEPGLYFIPELIDIWKSENRFNSFIDYQAVEGFRDFTGARVEDNIVVTDNGCRILGEPIAKTPEELEALR